MSDEDRVSQAFEIIESRTQLKDPLPRGLSIRRDGFSRQQVVEAYAQAFEMIGGISRMAIWANANPDKFYALHSKLLPSTSINIGDNANVQIIHSIAPTPLDEHGEGVGAQPAKDS